MNGLRRAALLSFFMLSTFSVTGCAVEAVDDEAVDTAASAATIDNALYPNALYPNALYPNALYPNALYPNALYPNALDPSSLASLQDPGEAGTLSRQFIQYAVSCAFTPSQSFSFSWTDSSGVEHEVTDPGGVGLAPGWATGPLNITGQHLVSACLAARTNWFGETVIISMRSGVPPLDTMTPRSELEAYPDVEGAFWGNLFATTPELYTCYDPANVANDRANLRDCAIGYAEANGDVEPCGPITLTGPCDWSCGKLDAAGQYYPWCDAGRPGSAAVLADYVITTALPDLVGEVTPCDRRQ
jgi:hypothetical protein